jgi:hypothetical protein
MQNDLTRTEEAADASHRRLGWTNGMSRHGRSMVHFICRSSRYVRRTKLPRSRPKFTIQFADLSLPHPKILRMGAAQLASSNSSTASLAYSGRKNEPKMLLFCSGRLCELRGKPPNGLGVSFELCFSAMDQNYLTDKT